MSPDTFGFGFGPPPLEQGLAEKLPRFDVNGDEMRIIARKDYWDAAWPLVAPVKHLNRFRIIERVKEEDDPAQSTTIDAQVATGHYVVRFDLNTVEGRKLFLDAWWPTDADATCVSWTAQPGHDAELPYPSNTPLRSISIMARVNPTTMLSPMRFGVFPVTTTHLKALWDVGIRQMLWQLGPNGREFFKGKNFDKRFIEAPAGDPLRIEWSPGKRRQDHPWAVYCLMPNRPVTDSMNAWLSGTA